MSDTFVVFVNGVKIEDGNINPEWTVLRYLRKKLRLPGTKFACGEGGCGACTVMVSRLDPASGRISHFSVNACLAPICSVHGMAVTTTEGIGSTQTRLHPVQERLALAHGSQCGFCTPGFVMSMYTLLRNNPKPTMEEIEDNLVGNLCRCTGYRPILEGFRTFTEEGSQANGCGRADCCQLMQNGTPNGQSQNEYKNGLDLEHTPVLLDAGKLTPYDPTQEIIFPPELKLRPELYSKSLVFQGPRMTFYRPVTLQELIVLKDSYPQAKIVTGNTEVGVEARFKNQRFPIVIHPTHVPELLKIKLTSSHVEFGAAVPLSTIEAEFKKVIRQQPRYNTRVLSSVLEMLKLFAGTQIRNVAGLGGNIMTGSPISDLNPIFLASGAKLVFKSVEGEREILFDHNFYTGYRQNIAKNNEVLTTIKIPLTSENEYFMAYKQSRRKDDDIAIVNAAMKATFKPQSLEVTSVSLAFGGMAPTTILAKKTMGKICGKVWNTEMLEMVTSSLLEEMKLDSSSPGGMAEYRRAMTVSFFFKFFFTVRQELHYSYPSLMDPIAEEDLSIIQESVRRPVSSTQFFQNVPEGQEKIDLVGKPIAHVAAKKHSCGIATYNDDIPPFSNELHAAFVHSTRAFAKILSIDDSKARQMKGVENIFYACDVPGLNKFGVTVKDEEFFASEIVRAVGQVIGLVVATDSKIAREAAKAVEVSYEDLMHPIFTIEDAIRRDSMGAPQIIETGDIEKGFEQSDYVLEGESYIGGQEHFYMETNVHIAIPHEENEMEILCASQNLSSAQMSVASALGIPRNQVVCKVKRVGGAFGGKSTRSNAVCGPIAVAAAKTKRPVRIVMERDDDMLLTGGRHPFLGRWKIGFNKDGKLVSLDINVYANGGCTFDLSEAVIQRAIFNIDNAYKIENLKVAGRVCITNLPSNTGFRGFGTPQACFLIEDIVTRVAEYLKLDSKMLKELNFYKSGDKTHFGQVIPECNLQKCWNQVLESSDYDNMKKKVETFNRKTRYHKRGLSVIPIKYCLGFGPLFLNQSGALVTIYSDGSVLISHGAMEMGQGVHTKMIQVASRALKIPMDVIHIAETSTDKIPNCPPSAGSMSTDLNGMAILNACETIMERLAPYKKKLPDGKWQDWVMAAFLDRVSLSVFSFYRTPGLESYSLEKREGSPFNYFAFGAAVSLVEIDTLTGDHELLRTDIVMDVGTSLNPAIDIGQIEGAFMQGRGHFTIEQLVFSSSGSLLTRGPGAYKIPSVKDIPREFNVALLRDSYNPRAIYSSKAIGEPPLFSGASVFFAIREAIKATRENNTVEEGFQFNSPATAERIRMACLDHITQQIKPEETDSAPWALNI